MERIGRWLKIIEPLLPALKWAGQALLTIAGGVVSGWATWATDALAQFKPASYIIAGLLGACAVAFVLACIGWFTSALAKATHLRGFVRPTDGVNPLDQTFTNRRVRIIFYPGTTLTMGRRTMTTSPTSFLSEILNYDVIPPGKLAYFRARLQDRLYEFVTSEVIARESAGTLSRTDLARRIGKDPSQITRWLANPGNWTLDTISDLLLGVFASELDAKLLPLAAHVPVTSTSVDTTDDTVDDVGVSNGNVHHLFDMAA